MATSYFPFDAGAGSAISESSWQKMARRWLKSGVLTDYLNALAVTADGTGMTVSVNTGGAWVEGFYFENDAAAAQTITAAHATLSRIDRIAVRLDRTANTVALVVLTGTAAASPVAPTLSVSDTLYEIGLATVLVDPAVGVIAAGKVTDTRTLVKNLTEADASAAYLSARSIPAGALAAGTGVPTLGVTGSFYPVWLLDSATSESVGAVIHVPDTWATVAVDAYLVNPAASTGNYVYRSISQSIAVGAAFAPGGGTSTTVAALGQDTLQKVTILTGLAAGADRSLLVGIERQGANAADTLANDIGVLGFVVRKVS